MSQPLAGGHSFGGHGVGCHDGAQVVDGLFQSVCFHEEVQLVVLPGPQREVLGGESDQTIAHLLLHQQHLSVGAAAQCLLGEVTGASDALLTLQQAVQLGLEHLKAAPVDIIANECCLKKC